MRLRLRPHVVDGFDGRTRKFELTAWLEADRAAVEPGRALQRDDGIAL